MRAAFSLIIGIRASISASIFSRSSGNPPSKRITSVSCEQFTVVLQSKCSMNARISWAISSSVGATQRPAAISSASGQVFTGASDTIRVVLGAALLKASAEAMAFSMPRPAPAMPAR